MVKKREKTPYNGRNRGNEIKVYEALRILRTPQWIYDQTTSWSGATRPDFSNQLYKVIIEVDGKQHYDSSMFGKTINEQRKSDKRKEKLARANGYKILRISEDFLRTKTVQEIAQIIKDFIENLDTKLQVSYLEKDNEYHMHKREEWSPLVSCGFLLFGIFTANPYLIIASVLNEGVMNSEGNGKRNKT